jgi:hypothetical protein
VRGEDAYNPVNLDIEAFRKHFIYNLVFGQMLERSLDIAPELVMMEESLCNVEFLKNNNTYIARVQSELGGLREYQSSSLEEVLEQVIIDLQEEFETSM